MYREWKEMEFPKGYYIWIWEQQDWEVDQERDGKMRWERNGRIIGGEVWQEKVHNREEWKKVLRTARNSCILHMQMKCMNEWIILFLKNCIHMMFCNWSAPIMLWIHKAFHIRCAKLQDVLKGKDKVIPLQARCGPEGG